MEFSNFCLLPHRLQVYKNIMLANEYQSSKLCEALYTRCEDKMDHLQVLRLPTMAKFNAGFIQCNQSFHSECVGPSKINYEKRMMKVSTCCFFLFIIKKIFLNILSVTLVLTTWLNLVCVGRLRERKK